MEKFNTSCFADLAVSHRKIKASFFQQIDILINWTKIELLIKRHYNKGKSASGRQSYSGLLLFKMLLLQTWYGLSDYELEDQVNDRISFSRFVGLSLEDSVPDNSVISRFRTVLTNANAFESLLQEVNSQLEEHRIIVRTGVIVDASITDTPRKPRGKKTYEAVEDRNEENTQGKVELVEHLQSHVDKDARWTKKANKLRFGYKQHTAVDENGMIMGVVTTAANESDTTHLKDVLDKTPLLPRATVKADKGYKSQSNDKILSEKNLKNRIMHKASRCHPMTQAEVRFNKLISKTRFKVERTFGAMRRWFGAGTARYVGIAKMHTQHLIEAMAHNLYRAPRIAMSICENS